MNRQQRRLLYKKNKHNPILKSLNKPPKYKLKKERYLFKDGEEVYLNPEGINNNHKNGMNGKYEKFVGENINKKMHIKYIDSIFMQGGTFGLEECNFYFHSTELFNEEMYEMYINKKRRT